MPTTNHLKRFAAAAACACALLGATQLPSSSADLSGQIQANKSVEQTLQSQISAESAQIARTAGGVAAAQQHLQVVDARLQSSIDNLRSVQGSLWDSREQVLRLERRLSFASRVLAANLRASYETGSPNLVDVIFSAKGFQSLLNQVGFMKRVQKQDAQIVNFTKTARARVLAQTVRLGKLEQRDRDLTSQILAQRNQAAAIRGALLQREITEQSQRSGNRAKLAHISSQTQALQDKLTALEAAAARAAKESALQVNEQVGHVAIDTSSMVQAPPGAPQAVSEMIAAGNAIATLPYVWGGGHGGFGLQAGYDCSGSVSYVLAAAGLLSTPEVSGSLMSYGDPGPGQWVTIYANAGHVWMTIAGWRFDTVALAENGSRWSRGGGEFAGFVVRHPPGL